MGLTIQDIANLSKTSKSTVSRYLNGGSVSKKTAERIQQAITNTEFKINISASRLKKQRSNLIGVLYEGFESISVSKMLSSINSQLKSMGYQPFIMLDEIDENNRLENVKALVNQGVDGIIFGAGTITQEHIKYLSAIKVPVILIGQKSELIPYRKVDDYQAGYQLGLYLSKNKYKNIVFFSRPATDKALGIERTEGFIKGITKDENVKVTCIETDFNMSSAYKQMAKALSNSPDLIVGATDKMAMGVIEYLNEHHISIPEQVAVAGFGNYEYDKALCPSLTSVAFDYKALGIDAAKSIVALINEEEIEHSNNSYQIDVIPRGSTKTSPKK